MDQPAINHIFPVGKSMGIDVYTLYTSYKKISWMVSFPVLSDIGYMWPMVYFFIIEKYSNPKL